MITVLNELVIASIKAEMAYQKVTQLDLALRIDRSPAYVQRRLSGQAPLSITDAERIGLALDATFLEPRRHALTTRRASLCQAM
jgi:transcriptional regulator with XRE-family HTH domain